RSELWLDAAVAARVAAYAAALGPTDANPGAGKEQLSAERRRFVDRALHQLRRRGALLGPHAADRLRRIDAELTELGQQFVSAITASAPTLRVAPAALAGLPPSFRATHPPEPDGKVTLTTDYPDYFPVVTYAEDRQLARQLYVAFVNRGGKPNLARLERLLHLRYEKAQLLGYPSWADYVLEDRLVGSVSKATAFLRRTRAVIRPLAEVELERFQGELDRLGLPRGVGLSPPDRYFLAERIRRRAHGFDSTELAEYFDVRRVTQGLLELGGALFGLQFRPVAVPTWHADVAVYDVLSGDAPHGRIYLDLHSRAHKYKHAAMFPIRSRRRLPSGALQSPQAALLCNFPRPGEPMPHSQVVTYFHEFGHLLHHLLTETELTFFGGTNTVRDFVEVPSQVFEQWAYSFGVLQSMTRHRRTGRPIDRDLFDRLSRARRVGLALGTERQLYLAELDLAYHARRPGFDTTELLRATRLRWSSFEFVEGTHFQSSFGHLIGYDASYYAYPYAQALAWDAFSRFERAGLSDPATARAWRTEVLARGGSADETALLAAFVGRAPNARAYHRFLRGEP
ncbi:MAG: Zn-dependent oligopeptidase, partial [Deltaproteobacteria bacterium]|nr:Zn-dependent oligopeptidase [Deltaproteobacteria bacterium]MBW2536872.1 Zn-dependent oligopeptidase [Deltaproteobacteria bacterium]